MKRLISFLTFILLCVPFSFADVSLIAVLNNNGEISTYTSTTAFKDALDNAQEGAIISLSGGNFVGANITKNVTVRGSSMMPGENPTILNGNFEININSSSSGTLTLEGLYVQGQCSLVQGNVINFMKCYFNVVRTNQSYLTINAVRAIHCIFENYVNIINTPNCKSLEFLNCYVESISKDNSIGMEMTNCVISNISGSNLSSFNNCIIHNGANLNICTFNNCVSNKVQLPGSIYAGNKYLPEISDFSMFFKEGGGVYELKDEYATTLIGGDGTQVGMYGGSLPFSTSNSGLKITKFNVASKTTSDGMLPIEISIEAE